MPDIVIRHCTLHIVRRGGWSWGPDPRGLVRKAARALGSLLERRFAEMWPDGADIDVVAPVRLAIALRFTELTEASENGYDGGLEYVLHERFRTAVEQAVTQAVNASPALNAPEPPVSAPPKSRLDEASASPFEKLLKLLVMWSRGGELEQLLLAVGDRTVEDWHSTLLSIERGRPSDFVASAFEFHGASRPAGNERMPDGSVTLAAIVDFAGSTPARPSATRVDVLRARIIVAVATVVQSGTGAIGPALVAALDRSFPLPLATTVTFPPRSAAPESNSTIPETAAVPTHRGPSARPNAVPRTAAATTRAVWWRQPANARAEEGTAHSALPFLMLATLSKMEYFDALDAMLSAADLSPAAPLFATALAYKVIDPPERGWRRSPAATTTAALFAGLDEPASNEALAEFARKAADFLPALDRLVAGALASGHDDGSPLLLCEVSAGGWLLAEVEGVFPVAWSSSWEGLLGTVERFGRPRLLVPASSAGGGLLTRLDTEGYRFITDTPPTRGERWKRFHRLPHERWCTNDAHAPEGPLVASARKLASAHQSLDTTWEELALRPCVTPGDGGALETSLMLSAAVALADISWNLWKDSGDTDPMLAIERFSDLDARVRFSPGEVLIKLPRGKRSIDLSRHGLLDDVAGVPWFGGRVVRFSGG